MISLPAVVSKSAITRVPSKVTAEVMELFAMLVLPSKLELIAVPIASYSASMSVREITSESSVGS